MSTQFPQLLDPWRAAHAEQTITASIALRQLRRVHDKLVLEALSDDARIHFSADFSRDSHGRPLIHLQLKGQVPLRCQRSLNTYQQDVIAESWVVIVRDEAEAERVSDEHEPVLLRDKALALRDLVEEELLLALPLVPLDPGAIAAIVSPALVPEQVRNVAVEKKSAFASLSQLLEGDVPGDKLN